MEKQHNNDQSAADADCGADTLTDNSYVSSSGSDSDESNTSLLEKNSILSDKFMLPKDLCENAAIFNEFFSPSLWDSMPQTCRQHLIKFLPISPEDQPSEPTKLVHDLFTHKLHRFGTDQMTVFQHNLAEGNFRSDIVKLRCSLGKSLRKERKMLELQRMARLAQNVVLSREATLLAELQTNGGSFMPPAFPPSFAPSGYRNRWARQLHGTKEMEKCRINAKKRYLREICSVSELTGIPLSISDEEDCLDAIPSGPVRKQRRMFGAGAPHVSSDNSQSIHRQGNNVTFGGGQKRASHPGGTSGIGANVFDGTNFVTPKLFVVTDEHYQKLLLQYRKRKIEEPNHPELDLDGVKLKDVVSRTQLAAGYRRILPLPKVYMPETMNEGSIDDSEKVRSLKSIKASRMSSDQDDSKYTPNTAIMKTGSVVAKVEPFENDGKLIPKVEQLSSSMFDLSNAQMDVKPPTATLCKQEDIETLLPTVAPDLPGACFADQSEEKIIASTKKQQTLPMVKPGTETEASGPGAVAVDIIIGNDTHACFLSLVRDLFCSNPDHRSTMGELQVKLNAWAKSATAARNSWYNEYQNNGDWNLTLQSAVQFLTGEFQHQPEDFVPYIEHKVALNILQWIGASRDGDCRLVPLCAFWQSRKLEMGLTFTGRHPKTPSIATNVHGAAGTPTTGNTAGSASGTAAPAPSAKGKNKNSITNTKLLLLSSNSSSSSSSSLSSISSMTTIGDGSPMLAEAPAAGSMSLGAALCSNHGDDDGSVSERSVSPPPPRFPTDWAVRKATDEEVRSFREQEKLRYENPHMAFTYKQHSYDSVVGPVKGIYTQVPGISKARGHSMLVADRPNFVTILTLVRDATARLPNGEGTRADICELLKSSQYISPTATDQILQTIVSGALDRMHTEHDPCVKYDAKRKIWIYLHRNRTEEEFERLHLQYQGFTKHKKTVVRKSTKCHKENASPTSKSASKIASVENAPTDSLSSVDMAHEQSGSGDLSSGATSHLELSNATGGNAVAIKSPVVSAPVASSSVKPATSLLKKQPLSSISNAPPDEIYSGGGTLTKKVVQQPDQGMSQAGQQQPLLASTEPPTEPTMNIAPKTSGSVTIITSTGSSVKTIKIPKSSLSLATKPANVYGPNSSTVGGAQMENSSPVESGVPSYLTLPQKNVLVSTFVSTAKPSPETTSIVSTVGLRKVPSMPIVVQSSPAATHLQSSSTLVSSAAEVEKRVQPGSSVLSIRQLSNSNNTGIVVASGPTSATGAGVPDQSSPSVVPSQVLLQTKALQFPLSGATIVSSTGGSPGVKVSTTMVGVVAPSPKPIFTTSTGSSHIKTLPASATASILSAQNSPSAVVSTAILPPQRVVVSSGTAYTTANSIAGSAGITLKSSGLVTSVSGSQSTATIIPSNATHRVIRPATNLISTITLAKGQQSVLTPAQQKQILQNLLCQQQKQQILTAKKIGPAQVVASSATPVSGESKPGETTNQPAATVSLLQDNQRLAGAVSTFKLQHHPNANQTIRALSPQIVRITPTRVSGSGLASNAGSANSTTTIAVSSPMSPMSAGMKMMKVHPSGILTSTGTHTMLPAGTVATGNVVAVSGAAGAGSTATMRVLKTATGTTTVIKTAGVHGASPTATQLSPQTRTIHQAKLRKDGSSPIVSKVTVTPNVSSAGQLIQLESLLQKQGITTTTSTNLPGGVVGSTFLKIASTGKAGQPQFLQFSTNTTNVATGTQVAASVSPVTSVSGGGHQYTVLAQNPRNIISVTPSTAGTTNRPANMPITIVSSMAQDVNDGLKSPASTHVSGSAALASIGAVSTVSAATGATVLSHATGTGKLPQANKIKLFASNIATVSSGQQQQGTIISPKTSMTSTVLSGSGGEFLNAKIIGVRNVAAAKMKGGSSLSIMNAANLNIAHIGGKPIIIANSSALSGGASVSANTATGIVTNSNPGNSSAGTGSTMVLTSNANYSNVLQIDPSAKGKNVINASSVASGEGGGTAGTSGSGTNVNSQTGHLQTQTLMLGNQLVKVQTIQAATAGKLTHQKRHTTILSDGSSAGQRDTISAPSTILTTAGGCTVVPQQQQTAPLSASGNAATGAMSNAPKSISVNSSVAAGVMSKSIVKIQPGSSAASNTTAKVCLKRHCDTE
ncbi:nfrkb [Anopheles sinensis]|uniref:Nfrkb n=1 Tax=Anopheles sinensis TaxID=74873 RepID=A0A084W5P1_ANOSI|nr:nfrkb [Anopheles sinensis]